MEKATIFGVEDGDLDYYWPIALPWISDALEHTDGETTLDRIRSDIANHQKQLWIVKFGDSYLAAVVTCIIDHHSGIKTGEILIAGGSDHDKWDHFTDLVGDWFKSQGCKFIDIVGRPGWKKLYEKRGFVQKYVFLRKEL